MNKRKKINKKLVFCIILIIMLVGTICMLLNTKSFKQVERQADKTNSVESISKENIEKTSKTIERKKRKSSNENLEQITTVELNKENCEYSIKKSGNSVVIDKYEGIEDSIIIPTEIDEKKVKEISAEAFKDCYNLETILVPVTLKDSITEIVDFEINENSENDEYIEFNTTREYSELYLGYLSLTEEEKLKEEIIPDKFSVPAEEVYSDEMKKIYGDVSNEEIPDSFDLRDHIDIEVESQDSYGICYSYATLSSIETNIALKRGEVVDLSEIHYVIGTDQGYGGHFQPATNKYFANKIGPVYEEDWPKDNLKETMSEEEFKNIKDYLSNENSKVTQADLKSIKEQMEKTKSVAFVSKTVNMPSISLAMKENEDKKEAVKDIRNTIKKHIMEYGSLYTSLCMGGETEYNGNMVMNYTGKYQRGHAISMIGWDDNFSKENFPENIRPKEDGAYLMLNSWGDDWGNEGCFWVSYEDERVESYLLGVISVEDISENLKVSQMNIKDIDKNQTLSNHDITKGSKIEINLDLISENTIIEDDINVKIRNRKDDFTSFSTINVIEVEPNKSAINLLIETKKLNVGTYIIEVEYQGETISKTFKIKSNIFDYTINEDGESITIISYTGNEKEIFIPKEYLGYKVLELEKKHFIAKLL